MLEFGLGVWTDLHSRRSVIGIEAGGVGLTQNDTGVWFNQPLPEHHL
jgi:hypothetical protein